MLVVSQVALSLVLLVGSLLFVRTLRNLLTLDPGFRQDGIMVANIDLTRMKIPAGQRQEFKRDLLGAHSSGAGNRQRGGRGNRADQRE